MGKQEESKTYEKMTPEEKAQLAKDHLEKHKEWLSFIIKDKEQSIFEFRGKEKQVRILTSERDHYAEEPKQLTGYTKVVQEFENEELKELYGQILNKNIAIIACKKDTVYCDQKRAEIRVLERKIKELEGKSKAEITEDSIPF